MARPTGPYTVQSLLDAGRAIIISGGATTLTLDAVVKRAHLSKGALLHHFKSKHSLAQRIMEDAIADFDAQVDRARTDDSHPGSYTRGYLTATLADITGTTARRNWQVMSALAQLPEMRPLLKRALRRWILAIEQDGIAPDVAQLVRVAADGLWLSEAIGAGSIDRVRRAQVVRLMLKMTLPSDGPSRQ
jgi:AcrR family transcriptional regulator